MEEKIVTAISKHQKPEKYLAYGTAGFRDKYELPLHSTFVRMGILACLRSLSMGAKCVGVMITASHNPEEDNGIKIVDVDGGMLAQSWEPYAEEFSNADASDFLKVFYAVVSKENIDLSEIGISVQPVVVIGRDTRPHSAELSLCVEVGIASLMGICYQLGEVVTPQLHFIVNHLNTTFPLQMMTDSAIDCLKHYYDTLYKGYSALVATAPSLCINGANLNKITVDASNGVGSIVLTDFSSTIHAGAVNNNHAPLLSIDIRNANGSGKVNDGCGAELVQKNQTPPKNVSPVDDANKLLCSFDGDGDRIIFHGFATIHSALEPTWIMLDGDKIATLVATFLHQELKLAGLENNFSFGVVQTAYANGASTQFLRSKGITVAIAKTGVKYVHHKALDFDVGVYFEANGHGTVLFSEGVTKAITSFDCAAARTNSHDARIIFAYERLQSCLLCINQTVGDALSDMLLCLAILKMNDMSMLQWHALYTDLPSHQLKVNVPDKSRVTCSDDETRILTPEAMQVDLDTAMASVTNGRCFVRPSGTEDVVRIYAEAATQDEAYTLSKLTRDAIEKHLC